MSELPIIDELGEQLHAGFRRREARRGQTRIAAAAATVAIAVTVAIAFTVGGSAPTASAAAQLRAVAHAAETQTSRLPGPRQFFFVRRRVRELVPIRASMNTPLSRHDVATLPRALVTFTYYDSTSATRTGEIAGRLVSVRFPTAAARRFWISLGRPSFAAVVPPRLRIVADDTIGIGASGTTISALLALPPRPRTIVRRVFAGSPATTVLGDVEQMNVYPLSPALRAAIYRALALVPGIRSYGPSRALTGRRGTAFGAGNGRDVYELIVDPATGAVLGSRLLTDGRVFEEHAVVQEAITNRVGPPRR